MNDVGLLHTEVAIEHPARRGARARLAGVLVDTGAELVWVPAPVLEAPELGRERDVQRCTTADGRPPARRVGYAVRHVGGEPAVDEGELGEPGDPALLGARTLEGPRLRVDLVARRPVAAGPRPAGLAAAA